MKRLLLLLILIPATAQGALLGQLFDTASLTNVPHTLNITASNFIGNGAFITNVANASNSLWSTYATNAFLATNSLFSGLSTNSINSTNSLYSGLSTNSLYSTNWVGIANSNNYRGRFTFEGDTWDDLTVPALSLRTGGSAPTLGDFVDGNTQVYLFSGTADQQGFFCLQLNHGFLPGSDIISHVHYAGISTGVAGNSNVVFELTYAWNSIDTVFGLPTTITVTNGVGAAFTHQVATFAPIAGTGKGISSILNCRLRRLSSSNNADNYTPNIAFLGIDFHYQRSTLGSQSATAK